jgi:hypothetical protein
MFGADDDTFDDIALLDTAIWNGFLDSTGNDVTDATRFSE